MQLIRIIPKHPGTVFSAAFGPIVMSGLGIGSTWMFSSTQVDEFDARLDTILKWTTAVSFTAIAGVFTWIHVRKQRRYESMAESLLVRHPIDQTSAKCAITLEPQLNWFESKPDWNVVAAELDRLAAPNQEGPVILCVGAIEPPADLALPATPKTVKLWASRVTYWMMLFTIAMMVGLIPFTIVMSVRRETPINTLQIAFWGVCGLGIIAALSQMSRLTGSAHRAWLELSSEFVEFVVQRRKNAAEVRRCYPLTHGTTIVFRLNPVYIGDMATLTFIRAGMTDSVSLFTTKRTVRLFHQVLALAQPPGATKAPSCE